MHGLLDAGNGSAEVDLAGGVMQVVDRRMRGIVGAKDLFRLVRFVRGPAIGDGHRAEDHALLIAQGDVLTQIEALGEFFRHIQRDRHGPECAVGQPHLVHDAVVIVFAQEPLERVEAAVHQQLYIADLTGCQVPAFQLPGLDLELLRGIVGNEEFWNGGEVFNRHRQCPGIVSYHAARGLF